MCGLGFDFCIKERRAKGGRGMFDRPSFTPLWPCLHACWVGLARGILKSLLIKLGIKCNRPKVFQHLLNS